MTETPNLQQRLVNALYGPGKRRSDTVEELADAMIAIFVSRRTALAPSVGAEEPTLDALRHECARAGLCSDMHDGCSCSDAELLKRALSATEASK